MCARAHATSPSRWIRLLFGREFPLPCVLELWDAVFADGPSLSLVDYICVAMLMHIREVCESCDMWAGPMNFIFVIKTACIQTLIYSSVFIK